MSSPQPHEEALFALALERPPDQRPAFLDFVCAGNPALRQRLAALLAAHDGTEILPPPGAPPIPATIKVRPPEPPDESVGQTLGRYKLLERIGEGGCGVVYVAEQTQPVRRRVALKVIKLGMDTKQVVARFEAERQALAMMDHPNIAKVLDAGTTEQGRPYFVMELVRGIRITDYCDQNQLTTKERLDLFIKVCHAIQHAHQKGIIHRDIKPSNILVTLHDGVPVPKVIDFGIAKATEGRLTDATVYTQLHQFIGTPAYMSPEQAEMSGLDIDTRSDIYSLGVLLYELLAGSTPFDAEELMGAGIDAMRRTIREKEPPRPSTKLSQTLVAADVRRLKSPSASASDSEEEIRASSRRLLRVKETIALLRGDLDWVVMKCLEKDRTRRYETANGLAADLKRHLENEPVTARPPSPAYKFQKAFRRNKLVFSAVAAIVLALAAGLGLAAIGWRQTLHAQQGETAQRKKAESALTVAETERKKAEAARISADEARQHAQDLLVEAAASDRAIAEDKLQTDTERPAFAYLARACEEDPKSTFAAEKAVAALNFWKHLLPTKILDVRNEILALSPDGSRLIAWLTNNAMGVVDATSGELLFTLSGHKKFFAIASFSPDGSRIITESSRETLVWDALRGKLLATLSARTNPLGAEFSPDATRILTESGLRPDQVWDSASGKLLATLWGGEHDRGEHEFSPDGTRIISISSSNSVRIWDAGTGRQITTLLADNNYAMDAHFSPDGRRVLAILSDSTARVLDAQSGAPLATLSGHGDQINDAEFSADGSQIVTASSDRTARVWDAKTGQDLVELPGNFGAVQKAKFSPDGSLIATIADDYAVRIWDAHTAEQLAILSGHNDGSPEFRFSPDGSQIITWSDDQAVRVWNLRDINQHAPSPSHYAVDGSTIWSQDHTQILDVSSNHLCHVWDATSGKMLTTLAGSEGCRLPQTNLYALPLSLRYTSATFSPDASHLVVVLTNQTAGVWDAKNGKLLATLSMPRGEVKDLWFNQDDSRVMAIFTDATVRLWNANNGDLLGTFSEQAGGDSNANFSPDGSHVLTVSNGTVRVWDSKNGELITKITSNDSYFWLVKYSPDSSQLLTMSANAARVWDANSGKLLSSALLPQMDGPVFSMSAEFSPEGPRVLGCFTNAVRVWDASNGRLLITFSGAVPAFASFSADGRRIVARSRVPWSRHTALVWDASDGRLLCTLKPDQDYGHLQISPDDKRIVTTSLSSDGGARLWDASSGKLLASLPVDGLRVNDVEFRENGASLFLAFADGTAHTYRILAPGAGAPPRWFPDFLRYLAQERLNSDGVLENLRDCFKIQNG